MRRRKNHYETLGVAPDADESEIRRAYRRLARRYHPDAGEGSSPEKFMDVQDAYEELGDTDRRREYDRRRSGPTEWTGPDEQRQGSYPRHTAPTVYVDLREVINRDGGRDRGRDGWRDRGYRGRYGGPAAEPIGRGPSRFCSPQESDRRDDCHDPWDELLDLLFRFRW